MAQKRQREAPELGEMLIRMTRALARRASEGEVEALLVLRDLQTHVDDALAAGVAGMHDFGFSYGYIGTELGLTRQWAQKIGQDYKRKAKR